MSDQSWFNCLLQASHSPVPVATNIESISMSVALEKVDVWDGASPDIDQVLAIAFEVENSRLCREPPKTRC